MTEAAALAAWLGGALVVLADGRRGLALGLALMAAGLAALALAAGQPSGAAAIAVGGAAAALLRFRSGPDGWGLMQPGSTPRLILTVVAGLVALWVAASVSTGEGAPLRFALLTSITLTGARLLEGGERAAALTAAAALALALGAGTAVAPADSVLAACLVAAIAAAGMSALSQAGPNGA